MGRWPWPPKLIELIQQTNQANERKKKNQFLFALICFRKLSKILEKI